MIPDIAHLNQAAKIYRRYLSGAELHTFDISSLDRIGIPIFVSALKTDDGFINDGFGYGGSSTEALVGALGEMSETYHVHQALKTAPACEALSYKDMVNHFSADCVIDPLTLCLSAGFPYHKDLPLRWVEVIRLGDGVRCWVPRECVAPSGASYATCSSRIEFQTSCRPAKLFPPITCGLGAGLTLEHALSHGVLELLQRDGNCTTFRAMDCGIDLDLDKLESEEISGIILKLGQLGLRVRAKLASTEFGLTNLYVIAEPIDPKQACESFSLLATACGEAVHANRERALRKALQEYLASRSRKLFMHGLLKDIKAIAPARYVETILEPSEPDGEEPKALREMAAWIGYSQAKLTAALKRTTFSTQQVVAFSSLPSVPDGQIQSPVDRLADISRRLAVEGISIYYFDASPDGLKGPQVIKAVAPGLEGETLSYWRIGMRGARRLLARGAGLVSQGAPQPQDLPIHLTAEAQAVLGDPVYFKVPEWERVLYGHYPLYREPSSHTVQKYLAKYAS